MGCSSMSSLSEEKEFQQKKLNIKALKKIVKIRDGKKN